MTQDELAQSVIEKIDKLNQIMVHHMEEDKITAWKLENYITADNEWKKQAQPSVDLGKNISWGGKAVAYLIGIIGGIGAIVAVIYSLSTRH